MADTVTLKDGRAVGYADFGPATGVPVLWCHGGPGSRLEPQGAVPAASALGLRLIGIDRPGYGVSTPQPGRTIGGWVEDGLAVADHLGLDRFLAVGVSTGGAYALALAASSPRVRGVVACCALSDMRWAEGKAMMGATIEIWSAPDRAAALALAERDFGADGSKLAGSMDAGALPPADVAFVTDPVWGPAFMGAMAAAFAAGPGGYADDRLADGPGWGSFDVTAVRCPVVVLHGEVDSIVPVAHAHHTAAIVPGARLDVRPGLGHLSIIGEVAAAAKALADAGP